MFFNCLNFLNDLNGLNFFKPWTHMNLLDSYTPKSENLSLTLYAANRGDKKIIAPSNQRNKSKIRICRGRDRPSRAAPRTDPDERNYRIRLLP